MAATIAAAAGAVRMAGGRHLGEDPQMAGAADGDPDPVLVRRAACSSPSFPIERVRSEHAIAERQPAPVAARRRRGRPRAARGGRASRRARRSSSGRCSAGRSPWSAGGEARPRLYDLATGRLLSPIPMTLAARIAEADHAGDAARGAGRAGRRERQPEYRGALPAWRVDFEDGAGRSLYVAADTGAVTARRSTLWRVYDFLWGLHIMDWRGHEDFNSPLLVVATALGLIMIVSRHRSCCRAGSASPPGCGAARRARLNAGRTPAAGRPA